MIQEDKQLLLKDLCARLPYGVIGLYSWKNHEPYERELTGLLFDELKSSWDSTEDSQFLPYLRPMSSMTEEEKVEYGDRCYFALNCIYKNQQYYLNQLFDWLNAHHFDYRGLIEKGLAIEVTEKDNPYKD